MSRDYTEITDEQLRTINKRAIEQPSYDALREQNRVLRGLVVYVEQIEADLHAALNGTRHDPSWIRPIQLSRNERQELYLGCLKQLQALKAALTATSQPAQEQCSYCKRPLTDNHSFSYGVPGVPRVYKCDRADCTKPATSQEGPHESR